MALRARIDGRTTRRAIAGTDLVRRPRARLRADQSTPADGKRRSGSPGGGWRGIRADRPGSAMPAPAGRGALRASSGLLGRGSRTRNRRVAACRGDTAPEQTGNSPAPLRVVRASGSGWPASSGGPPRPGWCAAATGPIPRGGRRAAAAPGTAPNTRRPLKSHFRRIYFRVGKPVQETGWSERWRALASRDVDPCAHGREAATSTRSLGGIHDVDR